MDRLYRRWFKRAFDLTAAATTLLLLVPVLAAIGVLVRLLHGSPILFRQERPGLCGSPFTIVKFRTMTDLRDSNEVLLPDSLRLTRFGRFLRSSSLDELPELWNVVRGDMSLVGPRPLLVQYLERYTPEQARRHEIRPGITGLAQIHGRNELTWENRFELDVWYVDHTSLCLDLKILALTLWKTFTREGISASGHVTMHEFRGPDSGNEGRIRSSP